MRLLEQSRPPGYAARGTSLGIFGLGMLSVAVPFITLACMLPVYTSAFDLWLASFPYILGTSFFFMIIISLNLHKRRLWYIYFIFVSGCLLLALYPLGFLFGLMVLLRAVPLQEPSLYKLSFFGVFCWLLTGIFAWWTLRMIRLRYWQPWTTAEQWEPGDESGPRWAQRMRERS